MSTEPLPMVAMTDVARTFNSGAAAVVALHDITCAVPAGARLAVVGPSGSGKSTLLHLLAGLDAPTRGAVTWPALGTHPRDLPAGSVGVVFQGASLLPALDAVENVALPLLLAGVGDEVATAAAVDALSHLGLDSVARLLPEELSAGQAQRVAVARALASRPRLIVADEPTGRLDHVSGAAAVAALEAAADAVGATLVIATHDTAVAARMAERWVMRDGTIEEAAWAR